MQQRVFLLSFEPLFTDILAQAGKEVGLSWRFAVTESETASTR